MRHTDKSIRDENTLQKPVYDESSCMSSDALRLRDVFSIIKRHIFYDIFSSWTDIKYYTFCYKFSSRADCRSEIWG